MPARSMPTAAITSRRRSFGNVILSRWPIAWSRGVMLPKTRLAEGFDLQRGYIEAVVMAPSGPIRIYCTHLSHVGPAQRLPQVEALLAAVRDADTKGATWDGGGPAEFMFQETAPAMPEAAIVAGDLNFTPDHVEYPKMVAAGLVDVCGRMEGRDLPRRGPDRPCVRDARSCAEGHARLGRSEHAGLGSLAGIRRARAVVLRWGRATPVARLLMLMRKSMTHHWSGAPQHKRFEEDR